MMVLPWYAIREAGGSAFTLFGSVMLIWPLLALCLRHARRPGPRPAGATLPAV